MAEYLCYSLVAMLPRASLLVLTSRRGKSLEGSARRGEERSRVGERNKTMNVDLASVHGILLECCCCCEIIIDLRDVNPKDSLTDNEREITAELVSRF